MVLKVKKITTLSQRQPISKQFCQTFFKKQCVIKKNIKGLKNSSGRNNVGKTTVWHKGGGHKKKYWIINFFWTNLSTGIICSIEYDPNWNANIASVFDYKAQKFYYILAPKNTTIGDIVQSGPNAQIKIGHSLPISKIPIGSFIHSVLLTTTKPSQIARSSGTFSKITQKTLTQAKIKLSSGIERFISTKCYATIGIVSNELFFLQKLKKAGHSRWLNKRPSVRGVATNPIDHPNGGGEGKKSGMGRTPWGKLLKSKQKLNG